MAIHVLFSMFLSTMTGTPNHERLVARCAGVSIFYREIASDRSIPLPARPVGDPRSDEEVIHGVEQQRLTRKLAELLIDFAAQRDHIQVTQAEIDALTPPHARTEEAYRKSFEPDLAAARAARRVLRGEERRKVFDEDLSKYPGMTFSFFENLMLIFRNEAIIDRFLAKDEPGLAWARVLDDTRRIAVLKRLRATLAERAKADGTPLDELKAAYWAGLLHDAGAAVLDPSFQLPDWKGVL